MDRALLVCGIALTAGGCVVVEDPDRDPPGAGDDGPAGMVFVLDNALEAAVVAWARGADGALTEIGAFPTGGAGTGEGLGSQGALVLSPDRSLLFAVSAGSDEVSSYRVYPDHLALVDVAPSGGDLPISVAAGDGRLYVVHAGGAGSVSGFAVDAAGRLDPIPGATAPLSDDVDPTGPAQVALSPDGGVLVVTEKATNRIVSWPVDADGALGDAVVTPSAGVTPFGFAFTPDGEHLVVSDASGGEEGASSVSSYAVDPSGALTAVTGALPTGQSGACWVAVAGGGAFAYVTNAGSGTVSGYEVAADGALAPFGGDHVAADLGAESGPLDMAVSADERFLYAVTNNDDLLVGLEIGPDGALTPLPDPVPVPATALGAAGF